MVKLRLALLLAGGVALIALPMATLETAPSVCVFRNVLGHPCPGCGMTRAVSAAIHGDFRAAWQYNHLVTLAGPLLAGLWVRQVWRDVRTLSRRRGLRRLPEGVA